MLSSLLKSLRFNNYSSNYTGTYPGIDNGNDLLVDMDEPSIGPLTALPEPSDREDVEHLLVFRPDHIGDAILTTPLLRALRIGFPKAHITILIGSWSRDIFSGNPDVDEIVVCDLPGLTRGGQIKWRKLFTTIRQLRQRRFDAIINTRTSAVTALFALLCGGRNRWGFDVPKARWAWTRTVPFEPTRHVVDAALDFISSMGLPLPLSTALELFPDERAQYRADLILSTVPSPFIVLHQGAGHPTKLWEAERWAQVADWVAENGYTPVFSGSAKEWEAVEAIRRHMDHTSINLAGHCDLLTFAEVIGRSPCVVSVDSASMHMAVAMQTPVVALFGPTDSRRWGPYPNGCANVVVEKQGDCSFCKCQSGCPERACMKMIETEEVIEAIGQVIYSEVQASTRLQPNQTSPDPAPLPAPQQALSGAQ